MRVLSSSNKSLVRTVMFMSSLVVLTLSAGAVSVYAQTDMAEEQWMENELREDHGASDSLEEDGLVKDPVENAFGVEEWKRDEIHGIYVIDSLADMPIDAVDLSAAGDGKVMGWLDTDNNLYIAGEGGVKAPEDSSALFAWYQNAEEIDLGGNLHTEETTDFRYMFYHCYNARKIDLEGMRTDCVQTFSKMFAYCQSIPELDLSSFDTRNSKSFYQMFIHCESLRKLDLTSFNPISARTLALMFYQCQSLEEILFSPERFDTSNVTRMTDLFLGCRNLSSLDVSWFNMGEVRSVKNMFMGCRSLPFIDLRNWDLGNVNSHEGMFAQSSLEYNYGANGEYFFG